MVFMILCAATGEASVFNLHHSQSDSVDPMMDDLGNPLAVP